MSGNIFSQESKKVWVPAMKELEGSQPTRQDQLSQDTFRCQQVCREDCLDCTTLKDFFQSHRLQSQLASINYNLWDNFRDFLLS